MSDEIIRIAFPLAFSCISAFLTYSAAATSSPFVGLLATITLGPQKSSLASRNFCLFPPLRVQNGESSEGTVTLYFWINSLTVLLSFSLSTKIPLLNFSDMNGEMMRLSMRLKLKMKPVLCSSQT